MLLRLVLASVAVFVAACSAGGSPSTPSIPPSNGGSHFPNVSNAPTLYVTDLNSQSVLIVRGSQVRRIKGPRTKILNPVAIAREGSGELVVADSGRPGSGEAGAVVSLPPKAGNVRAKSVITCQNFNPWGVAIDPSAHILVAGSMANAIYGYGPKAKGCNHPMFSIEGPLTELENPLGVATNSRGEIIVDNFGGAYSGGKVEVFAAGARGNVSPIALIAGSNTQIFHSEGVAVDGHDNIWVTVYGTAETPSAVLEFAKNANGNVAPKRVISGSNTRLNGIIGMAVDRRTGKIYVCSGGVPPSSPGGVLVFSATANGNVAPLTELVPYTFPSGIVISR